MDGHFKLKTLRPDLDEAQRATVIVSLIKSGIAEDKQWHNELGREAERRFPLGPTLLFVSKHPHDTRWLKLSYPDGSIPTALLRDLAAVGWTWDSGMRKRDIYDPLVPVPHAPAFGGRVEVDIVTKGSSLFGSWTPAEKRRYMREAKRALSMHGFVKVPHCKLTLADLL